MNIYDAVVRATAKSWAGLHPMLQSLGQWMMVVAALYAVVSIMELDAQFRSIFGIVIAVLGFALGYLFSVIDNTRGFSEDEPHSGAGVWPDMMP